MSTEFENFDQDDSNDERHSIRKGVNLVRHTETIDKLVIQNKTLQKDLSEAEIEIEILQDRLEDNSVRISKGLFYAGLLVLGYLVFIATSSINTVNTRLAEMKTVVEQYKTTIEKAELYNKIMTEQNLGGVKKPTEKK